MPAVLLTLVLVSACKKKQSADLLTDAWIEVQGDSIKDFGTYSAAKGEKKVATFVVKNVGTDNLVIQHIRTECGCTTAAFRKEPVEPGDTAHITVLYDGSGYAPGTFFKELWVTTNARSGLLRLGIRGNKTQ